MENKSVYAIAEDIYKIYKGIKDAEDVNMKMNLDLVMNQIFNGPKISLCGNPGIVFDKHENEYIVTYIEGLGVLNRVQYIYTIPEYNKIKSIFNNMKRKEK